MQYSPLLEYREGKGLVLFCQLDVTGRTEQDPAAETLARNLVRYVAGWKPPPRRQALYVGDPAGRRYLEFSGIAVQSYDGGKLSPEQVLIVATGGGRKLADNAAAIADFLKAGGHLLALGLDEAGSQRLPAVQGRHDEGRAHRLLLRAASGKLPALGSSAGGRA